MHLKEIRILLVVLIDVFNILLVGKNTSNLSIFHKDFFLCQKNLTVEMMLLIMCVLHTILPRKTEGRELQRS